MSKHTQQLFEQLKAGQQPSLIENLREAAGTAKEIGGQLWDSMKPMFDHGRTELAAALFAGHAHVMYMKGQEGNAQSPDQEQAFYPAKEAPEIHRSGREM